MADGKGALRLKYWTALERAGAARFPGTRGRIPNFTGAEEAAEVLASCDAWRRARRIKCNPDSPQRPVRRAALEAGKVVYMAVPKLVDAKPFFELDPSELPRSKLWKASSISGAAELGRPVALDEVPRLDLIVTGCVAVTREGARLGKGGGYADLEYGLLRQWGKVTEKTLVATTVHSAQLAPDGAIPMAAHDLSLDLIATPEEMIECERPFDRPPGILWDDLDPAKREAIPVLRRGGRPAGRGRA